MITKIAKYFCLSKRMYSIAMALLSSRLIHDREPLTAVHLLSSGWDVETIEIDVLPLTHYWVERGIKEQDKIWIRFDDDGGYYIYYGPDRTFIDYHINKTGLDLFILSVRRDERYVLGEH